MREFEFHTPEARQAIAIGALQIDELLDFWEPDLAGKPFIDQVETVTTEIAAASSLTHEHVVVMLGVCFVRLLETRPHPTDPDGPPHP